MNHKGESIDVERLSDMKLVATYRFFLKYYNVIKKIKNEDKDYKEYITKIMLVREGLKREIRDRKVKMNQYNERDKINTR